MPTDSTATARQVLACPKSAGGSLDPMATSLLRRIKVGQGRVLRPSTICGEVQGPQRRNSTLFRRVEDMFIPSVFTRQRVFTLFLITDLFPLFLMDYLSPSRFPSPLLTPRGSMAMAHWSLDHPMSAEGC